MGVGVWEMRGGELRMRGGELRDEGWWIERLGVVD